MKPIALVCSVLVSIIVGACVRSISDDTSEALETAVYCSSIDGTEEVRHYYKDRKYIKVDCETSTETIEAGLDKRSSLDSVQQAAFFGIITGKRPVVVIYDRDDKEGIYEYRIRMVCENLGIEYRSIKSIKIKEK